MTSENSIKLDLPTLQAILGSYLDDLGRESKEEATELRGLLESSGSAYAQALQSIKVGLIASAFASTVLSDSDFAEHLASIDPARERWCAAMRATVFALGVETIEVSLNDDACSNRMRGRLNSAIIALEACE